MINSEEDTTEYNKKQTNTLSYLKADKISTITGFLVGITILNQKIIYKDDIKIVT